MHGNNNKSFKSQSPPIWSTAKRKLSCCRVFNTLNDCESNDSRFDPSRVYISNIVFKHLYKLLNLSDAAVVVAAGDDVSVY